MNLEWHALVARCERTGLAVRGGFHVRDDDALPAQASSSQGTIVLLGNVGPRMWHAFARARQHRPELALDDWTREIVSPLAGDLGARALFPFEGPPYVPFQQWARRAEAVHPSPIGILIHPVFGLWHGYRAALLFEDRLPLPPHEDAPSPCERCVEKPCLGACPATAFSAAGYDVIACVSYLEAQEVDVGATGRNTGALGLLRPASSCMEASCLARRACPVGQEFVYPLDQRQFHMQAFLRQWSRSNVA